MNPRCVLCGTDRKLQRHHLFSQTKVNKRLYGDLIHHPSNIVFACADCHLNSPIPKYTEAEFCAVLGITPRSKEAGLRKMREA